jgi:hypothetical protein
VALSLTFVNQVGAVNGLNQAAPGSFIPDTFVRWSQDVLFDRVGYLRRRAPYTTQLLYNATGTSISQPSGNAERVLGVISTRNFANEIIIGIIVGSASNTRILFYDSLYRKKSTTTLTSMSADTVVFSRAASSGGVFIGMFEQYGIASTTNKNLLYYWRGGAGEDGYSVNSCTLGITNNTGLTGAAKISNDKIERTAHGLPNGYPIEFTNVGTITGISTGTIYYIVSTAANDFQVASTVGGAAINLGGADDTVTFIIGGHVTYTNRITGTFDTTKLSAGMFVYRNAGTGDERYLGVLKSWANDGSYVDLEKDCIRTYGYGALADNNVSANIKFVNVRPYVHCHGRGLITKVKHGLTVTSGSVGSEGEGHFAAADLAGTTSGTRWALYRASDGEWLGDVASVTNNAALSLDSVYHTDLVEMNADEYIARPYTSISQINVATSYTGCFNTTYAGYQWYGNGGVAGTENRIVFSAYHDPEAVDLSKDAADSIIIPGIQQMRGIATSSSGLLIFLSDKTYILRGNYRSNFSLEELYPEGCLSAESIVEYGGGVFWASKNGLLFYDGATVRNLTENNLGSYYTDSIKSFNVDTHRIYGFFYKDYLFMTFTGFASNFKPLRYEPLYADTIDASASGFTSQELQDLDPSFVDSDFDIENNVPLYWRQYQMYSTEGVAGVNYSGFWGDSPDTDGVINRKWGESKQFVWGPTNFIENITFAIYLPTNAITTISNFDFRGFIKLDTAGGSKGYAGINAVNPDSSTGVYARLIDVDSMLNPINSHEEVLDSELSENRGKQAALYYKGPDFYMQTKHYPVGDPVLRKWFRQIMLNLYLLDGAVRMDIVDNEDNDNIDISRKRQTNWTVFGEAGYSWEYWEKNIINVTASPNKPIWSIVDSLSTSWYTLTNSEFTRRKKKISWRYPSAGFRLYQMNNYRPPNYTYSQRPHTLNMDAWSIGFKPMRSSRV